MSVYLKSRNLDLGEDNSFNIVLHREDAERIGVKEGELLYVGINDVDLYANIIETEDSIITTNDKYDLDISIVSYKLGVGYEF